MTRDVYVCLACVKREGAFTSVGQPGHGGVFVFEDLAAVKEFASANCNSAEAASNAVEAAEQQRNSPQVWQWLKVPMILAEHTGP